MCCVITLLTCQVQLLGYNGQLYSSEAAALKSPAGGVGVAVLAQVGEKTNPELEMIIKAASTLKYAGQIISIFFNTTRVIFPTQAPPPP